jgi:hypothetical protein
MNSRARQEEEEDKQQGNAFFILAASRRPIVPDDCVGPGFFWCFSRAYAAAAETETQ